MYCLKILALMSSHGSLKPGRLCLVKCQNSEQGWAGVPDFAALLMFIPVSTFHGWIMQNGQICQTIICINHSSRSRLLPRTCRSLSRLTVKRKEVFNYCYENSMTEYQSLTAAKINSSNGKKYVGHYPQTEIWLALDWYRSFLLSCPMASN